MRTASGDIDLIIFDCDGVLVDSEPLAMGVLLRSLRRLGLTVNRADAYREFLGRSLSEVRVSVRNSYDVFFDDTAMAQMREELYGEFRRELMTTQGVEPALDLLPDGMDICVVSSSRRERIRLSLELTGLLPRFEGRIFSGSEVVHAKPAPDLFLHAARQCGVPPHKCLVIEDSPAGIAAAKAAGMHVFAYTGGGHFRLARELPAEIDALRPDETFDDMRTLPALLWVDVASDAPDTVSSPLLTDGPPDAPQEGPPAAILAGPPEDALRAPEDSQESQKSISTPEDRTDRYTDFPTVVPENVSGFRGHATPEPKTEDNPIAEPEATDPEADDALTDAPLSDAPLTDVPFTDAPLARGSFPEAPFTLDMPPDELDEEREIVPEVDPFDEDRSEPRLDAWEELSRAPATSSFDDPAPGDRVEPRFDDWDLPPRTSISEPSGEDRTEPRFDPWDTREAEPVAEPESESEHDRTAPLPDPWDEPVILSDDPLPEFEPLDFEPASSESSGTDDEESAEAVHPSGSEATDTASEEAPDEEIATTDVPDSPPVAPVIETPQADDAPDDRLTEADADFAPFEGPRATPMVIDHDPASVIDVDAFRIERSPSTTNDEPATDAPSEPDEDTAPEAPAEVVAEDASAAFAPELVEEPEAATVAEPTPELEPEPEPETAQAPEAPSEAEPSPAITEPAPSPKDDTPEAGEDEDGREDEVPDFVEPPAEDVATLPVPATPSESGTEQPAPAIVSTEIDKNAPCVIGVDVGTSSVRAALFDENGTRIARAEHAITVHRTGAERGEYSSTEIWHTCCAAVREVIDASGFPPENVVGIGFDATCSLVVLDGLGRPLCISDDDAPERDTIAWFDHRAIEEAAEITGSQNPLLRYSGGVVSPEMEIPKVLWLKRNRPKTWAKVGHLFDLADFLTWRATGRLDRSQSTLTSKWMFLGHEAPGWNAPFFADLELSDMFTRGSIPHRATGIGEAIGSLTFEAAADLGLTRKCVVAAGMVDAHAGALGVLGEFVSAPDDLHRHLGLIAGTSSCVTGLSTQERDVPGAWGPCFGAVVPGAWLNEAGQSATGSLLDHIIRLHSAGGDPTQARHQRIIARIQQERAAHGARYAERLHVLPDFHGNRSPLAEPDALGVISGLDLDTSFDSLCRLYWRTSVGIALGLRHILETLNTHGYSIQTLHVTGGHTRNPLLMELYADALGCRVVTRSEDDAVLLGISMSAAAAAGLHPGLEASCEAMTAPGTERLPDIMKKSTYDKDYRIYLQMQDDRRRITRLST